MLDIGVYRQCLKDLVQDAIDHTDGSNRQMSEYLWSLKISGYFIRFKTEKKQALEEARKAFDEHRHWPLEIIISHLGLSAKEMRLPDQSGSEPQG